MVIGNPFTTGGPVSPQDKTKIYVRREADNRLLENCLKGEYSVVLTSRQMGKTSLLQHTIDELKKYDVASAFVDLSRIGAGNVTADEWYQSFLSIIIDTFRLSVDIEDWWKKSGNYTLNVKFWNFLSEILLSEVTERVVIFIDEIEITTRLEESVSDSFFATIRSLFVARGTEEKFQRLCFVLVGMAQISDLIRQPDITTFNIGKRIELESFTTDEIVPLIQTIPSKVKRDDLSNWIIRWTGGQPYLTQLICERLSQSTEPVSNKKIIDSLVEKLISENDQDLYSVHIATIGKNIASKPFSSLMLGVYALIINDENVPDIEDSIAIRYLKLFGLISSFGGILKVNNDIYLRMFDLRWIERQLRNLGAQTNLELTMVAARKHLSELSTATVSQNFMNSELMQGTKRTVKFDNLSKLSTRTEKDLAQVTKQSILSVDFAKTPTQTEEEFVEGTKQPTAPVEFTNITTQPERRFADPLLDADDISPNSEEQLVSEKETKWSFPGFILSVRNAHQAIWRKMWPFMAVSGFIISITIIIIGLYIHSILSLIVSGLTIIGILFSIGMIVSVRSEGSLVEGKLGGFLDKESNKFAGGVSLTEWVNRHVAYQTRSDILAQELAQANIPLKPREYLALNVLLGSLTSITFGIITGFNPLALVFGGIVGVIWLRIYIKRKQDNNLLKFENQLIGALSLIRSGLRAGYSTIQAIESVSYELPPPISTEFRRVVQEVQTGIPMESALDNMLRRIPSQNLYFIFTSINIQREIGGNLSDILNNILIRVRSYNQLFLEAKRLGYPTFDFFYTFSIIVILIHYLIFPNILGSIESFEWYRSALTAILIIWSLILILIGIIKDNKEQLLDQIHRVKQKKYIVAWNIALLSIAYLAGLPQILILWFMVLYFSQYNIGRYIVGSIWIFGVYSYLLQVNYPGILFQPERVQKISLVFENLSAFLSAYIKPTFQPSTLLDSALFPSFWLFLVAAVVTLSLLLIAAELRFSNHDTLMDERFAEYTQRGDIAFLEEVEFSRSLNDRFIVILLKKLGNITLRFTPHYEFLNLRKKLEHAGNPFFIDAPAFLLSRFASAFVLGYLVSIIRLNLFASNSYPSFIFIVIAAFAGYYLPNILLQTSIIRRQNTIRNSFIFILDLLTLCTGAGLGFEAAMSKVAEKWEDEVSLIFARTLREMQVGKSRSDAMRDMAERIGIPDFTHFISTIIQSEKLGLSLVTLLRLQSDEMFINHHENVLRELGNLDFYCKILFIILLSLVIVLWIFMPFLMPI